MPERPKRGDLREACIALAFRIVEEEGLDRLSLREVARRLNVSHQAPYKHFASRDHILAEMLARSFAEFAAYLEDRPKTDEEAADLESMGLAYLGFARLHPFRYRLMFLTPMPDPAQHPDMMQKAQHTFELLRQRLTTMQIKPASPLSLRTNSLDALFVWSTIHGLASILQSDILTTLGLSQEDQHRAISHCMARLGQALLP